MSRGVAECAVRTRWGARQRVRVDLHGISVFGPGDRRVLIRWEWCEGIEVQGTAGRSHVVIRSATDSIDLPGAAFGLDPPVLASRLEAARSIVQRSDVIAGLPG